MKPNSAEEFLKNKLPKPLDEFTMFSGRLAKVLMEEFASLREKETEYKFQCFIRSSHMSRKWEKWNEEWDKARTPTGEELDV